MTRVQTVNVISSKGSLPLLVPIGINLDDPNVRTAKAGTRLVSAGAGRRMASQYVAAIGGLPDDVRIIVRRAAKGLFPLLVAVAIQLDQPEVIAAKTGARFVAADAGGGLRPKMYPPSPVC